MYEKAHISNGWNERKKVYKRHTFDVHKQGKSQRNSTRNPLEVLCKNFVYIFRFLFAGKMDTSTLASPCYKERTYGCVGKFVRKYPNRKDFNMQRERNPRQEGECFAVISLISV